MTTTTPIRRTGHRRTARGLILGAAGALPVLATLTVVIAGTRPSPHPYPDQTPMATSPVPAVATRLHDLADHIASVPADQHTGPYTYTHSQGWNSRPPFGDDPGLIGRVDVQHWRHVNGSERLTDRRLPSWPGLDHVVDGNDRPQFAAAPVETEDFTAAELPQPGSITPETIATDPAALTTQLRHLRRWAGPVRLDTDALLFAITELGSYAYLGRAQRATILRVLADIPGLRYDGETTDIAGRTGFTVHFTDPGQATTSWVTINPTSGELMAYRRVFNQRHGPVFSQYQLLLEHDRREHL